MCVLDHDYRDNQMLREKVFEFMTTWSDMRMNSISIDKKFKSF